jgi:hypothetical protein
VWAVFVEDVVEIEQERPEVVDFFSALNVTLVMRFQLLAVWATQGGGGGGSADMFWGDSHYTHPFEEVEQHGLG